MAQVCSFRNDMPTANAQWLEVETRSLFAQGQPGHQANAAPQRNRSLADHAEVRLEVLSAEVVNVGC